MDKAIITSASNKFFPSLINLLGSIKKNYPNHPKIFVYDLGLFWMFRKELEQIENVEVLNIPHFCKFWRSCYTWKTYILSHPLSDLNFYLDAGTQILRPLDEIFLEIEKDGYFAVSQEVPLSLICPLEYKSLFFVNEIFYSQESITAGIFGFKKNGQINTTLTALYDAGLSGLSLGFSAGHGEIWKNKGINKSVFIRNCEHFRHDTTLLTLLLRRDLQNFHIHDINRFAGLSKNSHPEQFIWNLRLNFFTLGNLKAKLTHKKVNILIIWNRLIIKIFLFLRVIRLFLKGKLWSIRSLKK